MRQNDVFPKSLKAKKIIQIVDANLAACKELTLLLRLEGYQTAFSTSIDSAIATMSRQPPSAAIINLKIGEDSGLELLAHVKSKSIGAPVFMLADSPLAEAGVTAMKMGARDVHFRPLDNERLLASVRSGLWNDVVLGPYLGGRRAVEVQGFEKLTDRERQVLQLLTDGATNKAAGNALGITHRTVEVHRARIMEKMGARNTADLIRIVLTS